MTSKRGYCRLCTTDGPLFFFFFFFVYEHCTPQTTHVLAIIASAFASLTAVSSADDAMATPTHYHTRGVRSLAFPKKKDFAAFV